MLTAKEIQDIELYRTYKDGELSKSVCQKLKDFRFKITGEKEKNLCFCAKPDRINYRNAFYKLYDSLKTTHQPLDEQ